MKPKDVFKLWMIVILSLIAVDQGWSQDNTTISHALAMTGSPKYDQDFAHFEYANPEAPKGGDLKMAAIGTYDSFNPFIIRGVPAAGISRCRISTGG